jgi:hypothetical protein
VPGGRRRRLSGWCALTLLPALAAIALLAPIGQAARGTLAEQEARAATKTAEREERAAARTERRDAQRTARQQERKSQRRVLGKQGPNSADNTGADNTATKTDGVTTVTVTVSCSLVSVDYEGFNGGANTVSSKITVRDQEPPKTFNATFSFTGASATQTTPIKPGPGVYLIDVASHWKTNGLKGGVDIHLKEKCPPMPSYTIEKRQTIDGSELPFTTSTLTSEAGQTVDYEIALHNTGNVALTFSTLTDLHCDEGTISGGPGANPVAPDESSTFTCAHVLTEADANAGSRGNEASVTGTPPTGSPISQTSNEVVVIVTHRTPAPAFTIEKLQRIGGEGSFTTSTLNGNVGQTVEYEIRVDNTGNVTLTMGSLEDSRCDAGTIAGGPIGGMLAAGATTGYSCKHVLSGSDQSAGSYSNTATLTGTPPQGEGDPVTHASNTVAVNIPPAPPSGGGGGSSSSSSPSGGALSSTVNQAQSGVLGFSSVAAPALKVPQGCVRRTFKASVKSAGVHSVTFYLDGRKLRTMTSHSAHKGVITIEIDPAKLKVGPHKLMARITIAATASAKASHATRSVTVVRCRAALLTPKFTG